MSPVVSNPVVSNTVTATLDATGLLCPLPVLRARKAMRDVPPGGLLEVRATDPAALKDFPAFCEATGHTLEDSRAEAGGLYVFLLRKKAG
jgi:tRNA 2-thiouridine synthesizing protein A